MRALSSLMVGLGLVSGLVMLALVAEIYYLFWWKKREVNREVMEDFKNPARHLLYFCCWKRPSRSTAINPQEICSSVSMSGSDEARLHSRTSKDFLIPFDGEEENVDVELMRLHNLSGPPRFLFTIKEETKEDLESDGAKSRKGSRGRSLSDFIFRTETPFRSPRSSPPFFTPPRTPIDWYCHNGLNPLFDSPKTDSMCIRVRSSPPPKFKFLKDAEEKLYRRTLMEEALRAQRSNFSEDVLKENLSVLSHPHVAAEGIDPCSSPSDEEFGSFIAIIVGKNREKDHQNSISSKVNPLASPPPSL